MQFGKVWNLDIASPREAVDAINCGRPGFKDAIMALDRKGMVFRVRSKNHDYDDTDVNTLLGTIKRIDIIPIVRGASAGVRFVVGAVLLVVSYFVPALAPYLVPLGLSLMLGAVVEWLTPIPKKDELKRLDSWTISGATNTVDQGAPVPVIYGEVLTGSYTISAGVSASEVIDGVGGVPVVQIGGNLSPAIRTGGGGTKTVVLSLSAGPFNMNGPYTYTWTKSGFALAGAIRVSNAGQATYRVELDYTLADDALVKDTGSVTVVVTGIAVDGTGSAVSATATGAVAVSVDASLYITPMGGATAADGAGPGSAAGAAAGAGPGSSP